MVEKIKLCLWLWGLMMMFASNAFAEELQIALTDQYNERAVVVAFSEAESEPREVFSWAPTEEAGFREVARYRYPSDLRLRWHEGLGTQVFLTCASHGFCAMVEYPSGRCLWNDVVALESNLHAIELLPNGCIAVAASTGNFVRIYAAGSTETYAETFLQDAHGLLWDPAMNVLWAVGHSKLVAYEFTGTPERPELTACPDLAAQLPIANGHDVWPVYGDPDRLWVIAGGAFQYDKVEKRWILDYEGVRQLQTENIKSLANSQSGVCIRTRPNGTYTVWDTNVLTLLWPGEDFVREYTFEDAAFYRARVWSEKYQ